MSIPDDLQRTLPVDVVQTWTRPATVVPRAAYLAGGTAIAVHLGHRVSHQLPVPRQTIVDYWVRRQPEVVAALRRID